MLSQNSGDLGNSHGNHETPIKRGKQAFLKEPNTAESQQPNHRSLQDIDAVQLFQKFAAIVRVSEEDEQIELDYEEDVQRKLNYEDHIPTFKLDFEPKSSSMKKRHNKVGYNQREHHFTGINLFEVKPKEEEVSIAKTELTKINVGCQECKTPTMKERKKYRDLSKQAYKQFKDHRE